MSGLLGLISHGCCCGPAPYLYHPFLKGWSCGITINIETDWRDIHLNGIYDDENCNINCPNYITSSAPSCNSLDNDRFWNAANCDYGCITSSGTFQNLDSNQGQKDDWYYGICATPASSSGQHGLQNLEYCDATWGSDEACAGCEVANCKSLICTDGGAQQSNPEASCLCTDTVVVNQTNVHNKQCLQRSCGGEYGVCFCDSHPGEDNNPIGKRSQHGLSVDKWGGGESEYAAALPAALRINNPVVQDALVIEPHDNQPAGCVLDCRLILHFQEVIVDEQYPIPNTNPQEYVESDLEMYPSIYAYFFLAPLCRFGNGGGSAECMYAPDRTVAEVCLEDGFRTGPPNCGTYNVLYSEAPSYWAELKIKITVPAHGVIPEIDYEFFWRGYGTPVHIHEWIAYYCVDTLGNPLIKDQRTTETPPSEHWMGLRVPQSCLNRITGKYTQMTADGADDDGLALVGPKFLCDSIQVQVYVDPCEDSQRIAIPDNSDFFRSTQIDDTRFAWSGQYRYGYGFRMCLNNMNRIGSAAAFALVFGNNCGGPTACIDATGTNSFGPSNGCGGSIDYSGECAFSRGLCPNEGPITTPSGGNPVCCGCSPGICTRSETYQYTRSSFIGECQAGYILDAPLHWSRYNKDIYDGYARDWVGNSGAPGGTGCAYSDGCLFSSCTSNGVPHCAPDCNGQQGGVIPTWEILS